MDPTWHDDWHRLAALAEIAEGEGARIEIDGRAVIARRSDGELLAFRDPCPACGATLDRAPVAAASLRCPSCTATLPIGPDAPDSLHLPVMLVDDVAYVFLGQRDAP